MAKANLVLPNGTTVQIEGSAEEVANLLRTFSSGGPAEEKAAHRAVKSKKERRSAWKPEARGYGVNSGISERRLFQGQSILSATSARNSVNVATFIQSRPSPRLTELTKGRVLRRLKEGNKWVYVN